MASRIKGITIEIGGDATGLNDALAGVNKQIKTTQAELKDVERLLKLDPTNTELLQQRQQLLAKAVGDTESKLKSLKDAEKQAQEQFERGDISEEQYRALKREIIATEENLSKLEERAEQSNAALSKIGAVAENVAAGANKVASATSGISASAAAALAGIGAFAVNAAVASDDLNTLAKQTGFSTAELQKMEYAAARIDVEMETITGAAAKMTRNLVSTSAEVTGAWERLGVSVRDNNGELRSTTDIFYDTIEALSDVANETERDTLAMTLFGKSANALAGVVDDGGAALKALGNEAESLGLVLSQDTLDSLNAVNDQLDALKAQATASMARASAKALLAATPIIEDVVDVLADLFERVAALDEEQIKMAASALAVVAAISPVAKIVGGIATAIKGVTTALGFLSAHPILLAVGAVGLLTAGLIDMHREANASAEAAGNLMDTLSDGGAALGESVGSIEATASAADGLIDRLDELNANGLDDTEAIEYNQILNTLCQTVPELASLIDLETGAIDGGTDALRANTAAWKTNAKQQAYQGYLTELYSAQAEAMIELETNTIALSNAKQTLAIAEANVTALQAELTAATASGSDEYEYYQQALMEASGTLFEAGEEVDRLTSLVDQGTAANAEASAAIAEQEAAINGLMATESSMGEPAAAAVEATNAVETATEEATDAVADLAAKYAEAYNAAHASLSSQIGLFDTFSAELDEAQLSTSAMTETWSQQASALSEYAENLRLAAQYGIDDGLVASLADGSAESATYLDAIISDIEDAGVTTEGLGDDAQAFVNDFNAAFAETEMAREELAAVMAGIETELAETLPEGASFGSDLVDGMVAGIKNKSGTLYGTMSAIVSQAIQSARAAARSYSPSKETIDLFEDVGEGMIIGMQNRETDIVAAVHNTVSKALALDPSRTAQSAGVAIGSMSAGMLGGAGVQTNNSRTIQVSINNSFGSYDSAAGAAAANDLVRQINRALGRAY